MRSGSIKQQGSDRHGCSLEEKQWTMGDTGDDKAGEWSIMHPLVQTSYPCSRRRYLVRAEYIIFNLAQRSVDVSVNEH